MFTNSPGQAEFSFGNRELSCAYHPLVGKNKYRLQQQYSIFSQISLERKKYNLLEATVLSTAWLLQKLKAGKNRRLTYWYYLTAKIKNPPLFGVKFNIINIQHEKANCMDTHVVTQKCSVTVFNVTHTFVKAKKNKYDGLSFMCITGLHTKVNSSQSPGGLISVGMGMTRHLAHATQAQLSVLGFMKRSLHVTYSTFSAQTT